MTAINTTITNLPVSVEKTATATSSTIAVDDFVAQAAAIIRNSADNRDFNQIDKPLKELVTVTPKEKISQSLRNMVEMIEQTQMSTDLPEIYRHMILDMDCISKLPLDELSKYPEGFRIACAKYRAKNNPSSFCKDIKKYGITNQAALVEVAKIAIKGRWRMFGGCEISNYINDFGIEREEDRIEIAKEAARYDINFSKNFSSFQISSQNAILELVNIILSNLAEDNAVNEYLSKYINDFGIENENERIKIAKIAAQYSGFSLCFQNYKITNQQAIKEIAEITIKHDDFSFLNNIQSYQFSDQKDILQLVDVLLEKSHLVTDFIGRVNRFGIQEQESMIRISNGILHRIAKENDPTYRRKMCDSLSSNIHLFGLEQEEERIKIAKFIAQYDSDFLSHFQNYKITNQQAVKEISEIAIKHADPAFYEYIISCKISSHEDVAKLVDKLLTKSPHFINAVLRNIEEFGIRGQQIKIWMINQLLENPDNIEYVVNNIHNFSIENQDQLITWAKHIAEKKGEWLFSRLGNFQIQNKDAFLEIVQMAIHNKKPVNLTGLKDSGLDVETRAFLYSKCIRFPFYGNFSEVFSDNEKSLAYQFFPELVALDNSAHFSAPKFLIDLLEKEITGLSSTFTETLMGVFNKSLVAKSEEEPILALRCSVLDFAKHSPGLLKQLMAFLDNLETKEEHERSNVLPWMGELLHFCRLKNMSEAFAKHYPLFIALSNLKDPELRSDLTSYFIEELIYSRLDSLGGGKGAVIGKKDQARYFVGLLTASLWNQIEPYTQLDVSVNKKADVSKKIQSIPFPQKMQELLKNDGFNDNFKLNSFLKNLLKIMQTHELTDAEKGAILKNIIFTSDKNLKPKEQFKQIFRSCQLAALFISFDARKLCEISSPEQLDAYTQQLFSSLLHIQNDELNSITHLVEKWRNPLALLRYAITLHSLNEEERNKCLPLFKIYVESLAKGTFPATRYSLENPCEHMEKLRDAAPQLLEAWKKGAAFKIGGFKTVDTDDPCDLLLCGSEVGSCQSIDRSADYSKCLIAYLLDPKIRLMAVKNENGTILARSILRLLWDEQEKQFVLFQEKLYPVSCPKKFADMIDEACIERAKQLNIPLLKQNDQSNEGVTLTAFKGRAPFEYVDSANNAPMKTNNTGYTIRGCTYVYHPF